MIKNTKSKLTVTELVKEFHLNVISGEQNIDNTIHIIGLNRGGLELNGFNYYKKGSNRRILIFGSKEAAYLKFLDKETRISNFNILEKQNIPAIILGKGFNALKEIAEMSHNIIPILKTRFTVTEIFSKIGYYIDFRLAKRTNMHGTLLNIYGEGVLILGDSGIGKSEITLELIRKKHYFVCDDRVDIVKINKRLLGYANPLIKNMVEIRGIGIFDITQMFGVQSVIEETEIKLIVKLEKFDKNVRIDRIIEKFQTEQILGQKIPIITIPVAPGRNLAELIEAAVISYKLRKNKINTLSLLRRRLKKALKESV